MTTAFSYKPSFVKGLFYQNLLNKKSPVNTGDKGVQPMWAEIVYFPSTTAL